jgi:hypothetical protein
MSEMILAIGGPNSFQWVHDYGYLMRVADTGQMKAADYINDEPLPITATYNPPVVEYHYLKLGDPETKTIKKIYVSNDLNDEQALTLLQGWLMKQFITMESPDDNR